MATPFSIEDLDLDRYVGHDSFLEAVDALVADLAQPLQWNDWQRVFSKLITDGSFPDAPRDKKVWSTLRNRFMSERFGADWKVQLPKADVAKSVRLAAILETCTTEASALGAGALEDPDAPLQALGTSAQGAVGVAAATAEAGDGAQGAGPGALSTGSGGTNVVPTETPGGMELPLGGPSGGVLAVPKLPPPGVAELLSVPGQLAFEELGDGGASDTSSVYGRRAHQLANALEEAGFGDSALETGLNTAYVIRDYIRLYNELEPGMSLTVWASQCLTESKHLTTASSAEDSTARLLALGRLAGISPEQLKRLAETIPFYWSSDLPSPAKEQGAEHRFIGTPRAKEAGVKSSPPRGNTPGMQEFTPTDSGAVGSSKDATCRLLQTPPSS